MKLTDHQTEEKVIFKIFEWVLVLKMINAAWEIGLGWIILFDHKLKDTILFAVINELQEHPANLFASYLRHILLNINASTALFIGIYILFQGVLKVFLLVGLLKKQLWIYPVSMYIFFVFVFYQIYRIFHYHSPLLILMTGLDLFTILLIQHEYLVLKEEKELKS